MRRLAADGTATTETMRQVRVVIKLAMRDLTIQQAAARAECSENTLGRILRGKNVSLRTVARIVEGLGGRLELRFVSEKHNMLSNQ